MGKTFKKYNEQTKKWENFYVPDATIIQQMQDGADIIDTNVVVTNINYTGDEEKTTLNDTLSTISDDISRLQRNVSWLSEHGGGGGGQGGGGGFSDYGVVITSPTDITSEGYVYVDATALTVTFMITGGSQSDTCSYRYRYDTDLSQEVNVNFGEEVAIQLDLTKGNKKDHTLQISATVFGQQITPVSIRIFRSSLSIWFDTGATTHYENEILSIAQDDNLGIIPLVMSNGLVGSITTLSVLRGSDVVKTIDLPENTTTENQKLPNGILPGISFWDIVKNPVVNEQYVIYIDATARVGNIETSASRLQVRVRVINPNVLTISFGINGQAQSADPIDVEIDSTMIYNFKCYAPIDIKNIYYSAKIVKNGVATRLIGAYYDETLKEEGSTYTDNPYEKVETTIFSQYTISDMEYNVGDEATIYVKVWGAKSSRVEETSQRIRIVQTTSEIFPRQYPNRAGYTHGTMFASWNRKNVTDTSRDVWTSTVNDYVYIKSGSGTGPSTVVNDMVVLNGNNDSGLISTTAPRYLRLQNRAYASISLDQYYEEIKLITSVRYNGGFTISLTFMADDVANTNKTIFLWGQNDANTGSLVSGVRVDVDKIYWKAASANKLMSCNISPGVKHTIDFSFDGSLNLAKIYINGILNLVMPIDRESMDQSTFPDTIFIGANYIAGEVRNYCDVNIYELSIYTQSLNDVQIIVNGKNARLNGPEDDPSVKSDYSLWKIKNFFSGSNADTLFFNTASSSYRSEYSRDDITRVETNSNIPTITLYFSDNSGFTKKYFLGQHTTAETGRTFPATLSYFDPETKSILEDMRFNVSLQGTSTLMYRIKNLEIITSEMVEIDGETVPVLFQPKKNWFPEKQFTLKADVVDSSHANNAVIGEWINNSGVFSPNPAMEQFESNRPKEVDPSGNTRTHKIDGGTDYIDYDENVTIKHTLEGFPVLLFIHFDGSGEYTFVGIYSFNLGRYSYYNMGMKFLESFSRGDTASSNTPRKITYYKETNRLGTISSNDVKSFEFDNEANTSVAEHPTWSQYDPSIVSILGSYKYPSIQDPTTEPSFNGLCSLFESVAKAQISLTDKFNNIYPYKAVKINDNWQYVRDGDNVIDQTRTYTPITEKLDRSNTVSYFMIANAFGMTDSLAKNLTLRTWDNGEKWWPCFYDMDTALGLSNTGTEDIPVYAAIDKVTNDPVNGATFIYHDPLDGLGYSGYMSKLWGIFRDPYFVYSEYQTNSVPNDYIRAWSDIRATGRPLSTSDKFIVMMAERVETCGEIVYNCDYNGKYIQTDDFGDGTESAEASTVFLHGTRVEYVRKWLKNHLYFLDGVFDPRPYTELQQTYDDSPYLGAISFSVNAFYPETQAMIQFRVKAVTPTFIRLVGGGTGTGSKFYIKSATEEQIVSIPNSTSTNTAIAVYGSTLLSMFSGLNGAFRAIGSGAGAGSIRAIEIFDVKNSNGIQQYGLGSAFLNAIKYNGDSPLEEINVSNTKAPDTTCEVDLSNLTKVLRIDISNSDVSTLNLPKSSLDYLNVEYSKISSLTLRDQNKLSSISLAGCDSITQFSVTNCDSIGNISVSDKVSLLSSDIENNETVASINFTNCESLSTVNISGNKGLESVSLSNCSKLSTVYIGDNASLKSIYIRCDGRAMGNVSIRIYNCPMLETLNIGNITGEKVIDIDTASVSNIKSVDLSRFYGLSGIRYDDGYVETHPDGNVVIDFSPMSSLETAYLANIENLKYVRFKNNYEDGPVSVTQSTFENCNGLRRVFGYISLDGSSIFARKQYFKLNEDDAKNDGRYDYTVWHDDVEFFTGEYDTNIEIGTADMYAMFSYTMSSIGDVYYVFGKINEDVTSISAMFRGCENIRVAGMIDYETEEIIHEGFSKNCTNVDNVSYLFDGCSEFHGRISSYDMHVLSKYTTDFNSVFPDGLWYDNSEGLFARDNNIERIANFNPNFSNSTHESVEERYTSRAILASALLDGMDKIVTFENALNGGQILFYEEGAIDNISSVRCCELLKGKTKLKTIRNSFNHIIIGNGDVAKGIVCDPDDPDMASNYSSGITEISNSFTFEQEGGIRNAILIGNRMFESCKKSLRNISGSFGGNVLKLIDPNDADVCDNETKFPYRVFSGMTYLTDASNFFEHFAISPLRGFDTEDEGGEAIDKILVDEQTITIPTFVKNGETHSMFETNENLSRINSLFKNMYFGNYVLTPYGFRNNHIEYANEIFSEYTFLGNYDDPFIDWESRKARKVGQIPYGLFYQESDSQINPTIKTMDFAFEGTNGTNLDFYSIDTSSDDIMDYLEMSENGKWVWNKYLHDGTNNFKAKIQDLISNNPSIAADTEHYDLSIPAEIDGEYNDVDINRILSRYIGYATGTSEYIDSIKRNIFGKRNYFCPPDIFRYCENGNLTSINGVFKNRNSGIVNGNDTSSAAVYGYHGRIPSFIFEPVSMIESLSSIFFGLKLILPEVWPTENGTGTMYPQIFKKLNGIKSIQSMFEETIIWGKTSVADLFDAEQGSRVQSLSRMWALTNWYGKQEEDEDCKSVLDANAFANCSVLTDVSGMFEAGGPEYLYGESLFNGSAATIKYCASFLRNGRTNRGQLVPFWDRQIFTSPVTSYSECYKGLESSFPDAYSNPDARPFFI